MTTPTLTAPGPTGDRFIGNLAAFSADPLGFLTDCARTYGDVVTLGSHNVLLVNPADVERVLVDRDGAFVKTTDNSLLHARKQGFPEAMMNSEGEDWRHKRRRMSPVFARRMVAEATTVARQEVLRTLEHWQVGQVGEFDRDISALTLRTVTRLMFGSAMDQADIDAVGRLVSVIMDFSTSQITMPQWFPTSRGRRLRKSLKEIDDVLARIASSSVDGAADRAPVLHALLSDDPRPPAAEVRDELATLILSGFETSKNAIIWACHLLARHPEIAERVGAEADAAAESDGLEAFPFTDRVVREVLRLYPTTWITSRESVRETEFHGHLVPVGTTVTVCQWVTHRDARWYQDPESFLPQRWEGAAPARGAYFPFGLGPRACVGAAVATTEIVVAVAEICRRFRLEPADTEVLRPRPALALQAVGARFRLAAR